MIPLSSSEAASFLQRILKVFLTSARPVTCITEKGGRDDWKNGTSMKIFSGNEESERFTPQVSGHC